jgi:putative redox protein
MLGLLIRDRAGPFTRVDLYTEFLTGGQRKVEMIVGSIDLNDITGCPSKLCGIINLVSGKVRAMTRVEWKGGMSFEAVTPSGHAVVMDARKDHGGADNGASPMELLLVALAGCTGMDVVSILEKKKQSPESFMMELEADRRADHPRAYTEIRIKYIFKGGAVTEEGAKRAIELSEEKYCSVAATLKGAAKINYSFEIER